MNLMQDIDNISFENNLTDKEIFIYILEHSCNYDLIKRIFIINDDSNSWLTLDVFLLLKKQNKIFITKWFIENYINCIDKNIIEQLFDLFFDDKYFEILKMLKTNNCINLFKNNHERFKLACDKQFINIITWFLLMVNRYNYETINGKFIPIIKPLEIHTIKKNESCPICILDSNNCILNCGHSFCYHCIGSNFTDNQLCPLCRVYINKCFASL